MKYEKGCNESAATFAWFVRALGYDGGAGDLVSRRWRECRSAMLGSSRQFVNLHDWSADFWLCRGCTVEAGLLTPCWAPPQRISDWPLFEPPDSGELPAELTARPAQQNVVLNLLEHSEPADGDNAEAVEAFYALRKQSANHADVHMLKVEHVRAWLGASVGHLLMSIILTPPGEQQEQLVQATIDRLALPRSSCAAGNVPDQFHEHQLEYLYNARMTPGGKPTRPQLRSGQGEEWREHWNWLAQDIRAEEALSALQTAACLMRCNALLVALLLAMQQPDRYWSHMTLAVIRRWLLTLQVMCWLEHALQESWTEVRPSDLVCFALAALKPGWPRHELAISHRSGDAKQTLIDMLLWKAPWCAIDANFVPAWENNTGMVWGLFGATPDIVRIVSGSYMQSLWCRREFELTSHLAERGDFLRGRRILTVDGEATRSLDAWVSLRSGGSPERDEATPGLLSGFPPLTTVWRVPELADWETVLLRGAGALRILNAFAGDPATANKVAQVLATGHTLPPPAPTNNPDGWQMYASALGELRRLFASDDGLLPVRMPENYSAKSAAIDKELWMRVPDLARGHCHGADVLVAIEWCRTEFAALLDEGRGDHAVVNCQATRQHAWQNDSRYALSRGLLSMRWHHPVWLLQRAGQFVERWSHVGDRPIFTQYVADQFGWMLEAFLPRPEARRVYIERCGLELGDEVVRRLCNNDCAYS